MSLHREHPTLGSTVLQYLGDDGHLHRLHSDEAQGLNGQLLVLLEPLSHSWATRIVAFSAHFAAQHTTGPSHHTLLENFLGLAASQALPTRAADSVVSVTAPVTDLLELLLRLCADPGNTSGQALTEVKADMSLGEQAEFTAVTWEQQGGLPEQIQSRDPERDATVVSTSVLLLVKLLVMFSSWDFSERMERAVVAAMWVTLSNLTEASFLAQTSALCSMVQSKTSTSARQVTDKLEVTWVLKSVSQLMPSLLRLSFKQNNGQHRVCYAALRYLLAAPGSPSPSVGVELVRSGNKAISSRSCQQRGAALCIACTPHALCAGVTTVDMTRRCATLAGSGT